MPWFKMVVLRALTLITIFLLVLNLPRSSSRVRPSLVFSYILSFLGFFGPAIPFVGQGLAFLDGKRLAILLK